METGDNSTILASLVHVTNFAGFEFVSTDEIGRTCDLRFTLAAVGLLVVGLMLVYSWRSILRLVVHISVFCAVLTIDLTIPKSLEFITTMINNTGIEANRKGISAVLATVTIGLCYSFGCYRKSLYLLRLCGSILTGYTFIQMMPEENEFAYEVNMTLLNLDAVGLNHGDDTLCFCVAIGVFCLWLLNRSFGKLSFLMPFFCAPLIWLLPICRNHELVTSTPYLDDFFSSVERMLTILSSNRFICKQTVTLTIFGKLLGVAIGLIVLKLVDVDMMERGFSAVLGIVLCVIAMSYLSKELDNDDISYFCAIVFLLTIYAGYLAAPARSINVELHNDEGKMMQQLLANRQYEAVASKHQKSKADVQQPVE